MCSPIADTPGIDTDACRNSCAAASCGDGVVHVGVEECDDADGDDADACLSDCIAASCGDGIVHVGVEVCDDGASNGDHDGCAVHCGGLGPHCGDGVVDGPEQCDDGNQVNGDGCDAACATEALCGNQGGGNLTAENGTGMNKLYCYSAADSVDTRARKACESHFGIDACCLIVGGYADQQWGQCGMGGAAGTFHWHPDSHPGGNHCAPYYQVGDVVSPGWCGTVTGSFLD